MGGYAVGFRRTGGNPLVIVTGLDIGEAHLAPETVDPGEPEVRADDGSRSRNTQGLRRWGDRASHQPLPGRWPISLYKGEERLPESERALEARPHLPLYHGTHRLHDLPRGIS